MDCLDKTLLTSSESDLKAIYEEEQEKLRKNQMILDCLRKLEIENFPRDLNENSKRNIEKAILAAKVYDFLDLGNAQTLLNLDDFKLSKIKLTYIEQKMIKEQVEKLLNKLPKENESNKLDEKITKIRSDLINLEMENRELVSTLEKLKNEELNLMKEITEIFVGSDQKDFIVKGLLDEAEIEDMRAKQSTNAAENFLVDQTSKSKEVFDEITAYIDHLIQNKK